MRKTHTAQALSPRHSRTANIGNSPTQATVIKSEQSDMTSAIVRLQQAIFDAKVRFVRASPFSILLFGGNKL